MKALFVRFAKDQSGATTVEYGMVTALVSVFCITLLTAGGKI
jgi:pilus assembly protein Flp/PilA